MSLKINIEEFYDDEEFRDSIATVDKEGKRIWVYPKKPSGPFHNKRIIATFIFLFVFFSAPLIKIKGQPLLMMNIFDRKFVIFGQVFFPQDFVLFGLGMITFFVFIILFTVVFGRFWCGWACPQTVFLEMIFRKIEYWIEGDAKQQRILNNSPWTNDKILKKGSKHFIYLLFSVIIAHTTMAYIVGLEETLKIVRQPPANNLTGFISIIAFTVIFYYVFAKLREQVCIAICPYGRLQGVLFGRTTMGIMYDFVRGEPRGKLNKLHEEEATHKGDCIDCKLCVQVCPTGIDIRNGTQLECVNCTACIDVCDDVMIKIDKPVGLIRYASQASIEDKVPFTMSVRAYAYSVVLLLLVGIEVFLLMSRTMIETTIMRVPGQMYQEQTNGNLSNLYNAQFVNKTTEDLSLLLKVEGNVGKIRMVGNKILVPKQGRYDVVFFVDIPENEIHSMKTPIKIQVIHNSELVESVKTNFLGPAQD
jgi:cytochrome c oxidase accessory protein FixG